jgi:hypothetical protein
VQTPWVQTLEARVRGCHLLVIAYISERGELYHPVFGTLLHDLAFLLLTSRSRQLDIQPASGETAGYTCGPALIQGIWVLYPSTNLTADTSLQGHGMTYWAERCLNLDKLWIILSAAAQGRLARGSTYHQERALRLASLVRLVRLVRLTFSLYTFQCERIKRLVRVGSSTLNRTRPTRKSAAKPIMPRRFGLNELPLSGHRESVLVDSERQRSTSRVERIDSFSCGRRMGKVRCTS